MPKLLRRLWYVFRQDRHERDLSEELRFHVEMKQQELEASGLDPETAAATARRAVGNVPLTHNKVRDVWIWPWVRFTGWLPSGIVTVTSVPITKTCSVCCFARS